MVVNDLVQCLFWDLLHISSQEPSGDKVYAIVGTRDPLGQLQRIYIKGLCPLG